MGGMSNIAAIGDFMQNLDVEESDSVEISYHDGIATLNIQKNDGRVLQQTIYTNGGFKEFTQYDPRDANLDQKKEMTKKLYRAGNTQVQIAKKLGISQSSVSLYVRES